MDKKYLIKVKYVIDLSGEFFNVYYKNHVVVVSLVNSGLNKNSKVNDIVDCLHERAILYCKSLNIDN